MSVWIAGYRPHKLIRDIPGRLICWWTRSEFSHVELVIAGQCYSSSLRDGGVRKKAINLGPSHWSLIPAPWVDADYALRFFEATEGDRYGYLDLIGQHVLRLPWHDRRGWLCSEWIAEACRLANPQQWHPGGLMEYARFRAETD